MAKKQNEINTIFIDCFNTIIIRKSSTNNIFRQWAKEVSSNFNIPWKAFYKTYKKVNFNLCFKKLITSFTLQESFDVVLDSVEAKLAKSFPETNFGDFKNLAKTAYIETELKNFELNQDIVNMLINEKSNGRQIYLISDFYCTSDVFEYWFKELNIHHLFDQLFSSCDFLKEKATGKIYKLLIKKLNINPQNTMMYGDNLWSDVFMAKRHKLLATHVKQNRRNYEK